MKSNKLTITDQRLIGETFTSYYKKLFTSSNPDDMDFCLREIQSGVTIAMNQKLLAAFSKHEIKEAIF